MALVSYQGESDALIVKGLGCFTATRGKWQPAKGDYRVRLSFHRCHWIEGAPFANPFQRIAVDG
jgi:hypothetical protein